MTWRPEGWKNPFDGLPAYPTEAGERIFETIFEAGADAMLEALTNKYNQLLKQYGLQFDVYDSGHQDGIKEVVNWIKEHSWDGFLQHWGAPLPDGSDSQVQCFDPDAWQAKLKEWQV